MAGYILYQNVALQKMMHSGVLRSGNDFGWVASNSKGGCNVNALLEYINGSLFLQLNT